MKQETLKLNDYYQTSDLALATTLSLYYPLEATDKDPNSFSVSFIFKREEGLDELVATYWRKGLKIEPQSYFYQLKSIKTRIHGQQ